MLEWLASSALAYSGGVMRRHTTGDNAVATSDYGSGVQSFTTTRLVALVAMLFAASLAQK